MDFKNDVVYMSEHTGCWGKCLNPQYLALVFFLSKLLGSFPLSHVLLSFNSLGDDFT
jgi:hypothetical protein